MKRIYLINILLLIFLCGCGKKQKNIFNFSKKPKNQKINKFRFGFIKGIDVKKTGSKGNLITWEKLKIPEAYNDSFIGYNVYRLNKFLLIPKKPINNKPILKTSILDKEVLFLSPDSMQDYYCYIIYPIFLINNKINYGAASQVACNT